MRTGTLWVGLGGIASWQLANPAHEKMQLGSDKTESQEKVACF